jgi:DNA-binding PucR family transcriptional regulator
VVEVGHMMATLIIREMPEFGGGAEAFDILRMGTESSTLQFLLNLGNGTNDRIATEEALDGVLDFVRRGIGMESVLRGTRLGHRGMSEAFLAACERLGDPKARVEEMKLLTTRLFEYMDAFSAALAGKYLEDQVRWSASDTAARLELVEAVLGGADPDPGAALKSLRYDLRGTHLAIVAWSTEARADVDSVELQEACLRLLTDIGVIRKLMIPVGAGRVWAWGELSDSGRVAEVISRTRLPANAHVVTGTPTAGIRGFRSSHFEAEAVSRLVPPRQAPLIVPYEQVDVLSLLLEDRRRAVEFAARELGGLAVDSPAHRDLRETVAVFLDEHGSTQAASLRLMVARNTVSYRIRRAEEIIGRHIRDEVPRLRSALMIASALPEEVHAVALG